MVSRMIGFVSLALPALFATGPAAAQFHDGGDVQQEHVDATPYDLSTQSGVDELDRRIERAVYRICGNDRQCQDEAWVSTDAQVDWAIERDRRTRQLADEREAQLRACEWQRCSRPQPVYQQAAPPQFSPRYAPQPASLPGRGMTTVTVTVTTYPPRIVYYGPPPRPRW